MDNNNSYTYEIKKNKNIKIVIIPIVLLLLLLIIVLFFINKPTPKSTILSFLDALQDYDNDKVCSFIDFEKMLMLKSTSNDFNNLNNNLIALSNNTLEEQNNFKESVSFTKRYINAIVDELEHDNVIFSINDIKISKVDTSDDISEITVNITIKKDDDIRVDNMTFYTLKSKNNYRIIGIYGGIYF